MNENNPRVILDWYEAHIIGDCICDRVLASECAGDMGPPDEPNEECPCECHYQAEEEDAERWMGAMLNRAVAEKRIEQKEICRKSRDKNRVVSSEPETMATDLHRGGDVA